MARRETLQQRRMMYGLSQERLGEKIGVNARTVRTWEAGTSTPLPEQRPALADALHVTMDDLDRLLDGLPIGEPHGVRSTGETQGTARQEQAHRTPPPDDAALPGGRPAAGEPVDVQALMSAAARRALDFGSVLATATVDDPDLDWLAVSLAELATEYVHTPAVDLLPRIVGVRDAAFTLIRRGVRPRQLRDAYLVAGTGCLLLASASQNLGDPAAARAQLHTAERCAEAADSDALRVWARGSAALALEWSPTPAAALRFLTPVSAGAVGTQTIRRTVALEARVSARTGDAARALDALRRLHDLETLPDRHDEVSAFGGIFTFPHTKQAYYRAGTHDLLGDPAAARRHAHDALTAYAAAPEQERSYGDVALTRIVLAHSHLRDRDFDAAAAALAPLRHLPFGERIAQLPPAVRRTRRLISDVGGVQRARELLGDLLDAPTAARSLDSSGDRTAP
ncbi:helix-turn-helix transcriptional regulator [Saccharothrix sp. NRRL B-16348]|uniref:helix-turn-helix transcriptional regulator n=1 Tax=Saccharothrix sp. NRRL B-16348 TaxID=1415542 RepID=UPI0006AF068D|nr:helix-turn-helix transcriptional regulator [Saccharothrix sp. NRRL B-16348]